VRAAAAKAGLLLDVARRNETHMTNKQITLTCACITKDFGPKCPGLLLCLYDSGNRPYGQSIFPTTPTGLVTREKSRKPSRHKTSSDIPQK